MCMDKEQIIKNVKMLLDDEPVSFAYLFGSMARGRAHAKSDVDIAVYLDPELDKLGRFDLRLRLTDKLAAHLVKDVDVVDLAAAPLSLRHYIMRDGILIIEKQRLQRIGFEVSSRREYFDLKRHLDRRSDAILNRQ